MKNYFKTQLGALVLLAALSGCYFDLGEPQGEEQPSQTEEGGLLTVENAPPDGLYAAGIYPRMPDGFSDADVLETITDDTPIVSSVASEEDGRVLFPLFLSASEGFTEDGLFFVVAASEETGTARYGTANFTAGRASIDWNDMTPVPDPIPDPAPPAPPAALVGFFAVSFDMNYANAPVQPKTIDVIDGGFAERPAPDPDRPGHTFGGWFTSADAAREWNFGTDKVTGNITLYAKWTLNTYTVKFITNGGGTVPDQRVEYGGKAIKPGTPVRGDGFVFDGWYTDIAFIGVCDFNLPVTRDITIYAKWIDLSGGLFVGFDTDNGSEVPFQTVRSGGTVTKPADPVKPMSVFAGWYADSSRTTPFNFTAPVTADTAVYAKWSRLFVVSFNTNGGSAVASQTISPGTVVTKPANPTRPGLYVFDDWYSNSSLTSRYVFGSAVTSDFTLYAGWHGPHLVRFDSNGGSAVPDQTVAHGGAITPVTAPTKAWFTFNAWCSDRALTSVYSSAPVTADIILYAKWTPTYYTVTFNTNGGSAIPPETVVRGDKVAFSNYTTKTAWGFSGWCSDSALTAYYNRSSPVTADITLYAKWVPGTYTITMEKYGGFWEGGGQDKYYYTTGDPAIVMPTTIVRVGYSFHGWFYNAETSGGNTVPNTGITPTSNTTLYAKWIKVSPRTVEFYVYEAIRTTHVTMEIPYASKIRRPSEEGTFPNDWTYPTFFWVPNNRFSGWFDSKNKDTEYGEGRKWVFGTDRVYKHMNLYGGWHWSASDPGKPMPGWND